MGISNFSASSSDGRQRKGFTLLEMAVSVAIIATLSGILVGYSRNLGQRLSLISAQSQFISIVGHAKSLSQSFVINPSLTSKVCAYGVHVDVANEKVFVFQDLVNALLSCDTSDNVYTVGEELQGELNNVFLDQAFDIDSTTDLADIIFIPPDPQVIINNNPLTTSASLVVKLHNDANEKFVLKVNNFGQVTL